MKPLIIFKVIKMVNTHEEYKVLVCPEVNTSLPKNI